MHGDLTPANILMCEHDARLRLTDFGMRIPGGSSDPFSAPELAAGGACTIQSDMYSLGVVLRHAALGESATGALVQPLTSALGREGVLTAFYGNPRQIFVTGTINF